MTKKGYKPGVYTIHNKEGRIVFRASLTRNGKHISLGSFSSEEDAHTAYLEGLHCLSDPQALPDEYPAGSALPFDKAVCLMNLRENGIYFSTPIFLGKRDFLYYLKQDDIYRFDIDDLFYFASHRIMRRGGRLFVSDYGSQIGVMTRFGVRSFAVPGRDYFFVNGDDHDLRRQNIRIVNRYRGVLHQEERGFTRYKAVIHVRGNYLIGVYGTEKEAAIAYNKAADILTRRGVRKKYELNYLEDVGPAEYAEIYQKLPVSPGILNWGS